jgi:pimeloyl-ACP methyl ester carboxylesterase
MADYVLVHGGDVSTETWNRLSKDVPVHTSNGRMGGRVWETVTPFLTEGGHQTYTPTLINEHNCNLHGHIEQITLLITENNLKKVILIGHSYGGLIITGVASQLPDRIDKLVYLDAVVPDPGQSLFDFLKSSGHEPLSKVPGLEAAMAYIDKIEFNPENIKTMPKFFIRCTKSELAAFTTVSLNKIKKNSDEWTNFDLEAGHVCQPTVPDKLAEILLKINEI